MYEINRAQFGSFVAQLRKEKGLTQKELARELYISDKAVSKWETGVSIPDTALLVPLAELLGVSVAELLLCQRVQQAEGLDAGQVEEAVKTAISYAGEPPALARWPKGWRIGIYLATLVVGCIAFGINHLQGQVSESTLTSLLLGSVFGAYFWLFVRERLPDYYDQNRIGGVHDGVFRMNIPGVAINNSNWPYLIWVGRIWTCGILAVYPFLAAAMQHFLPEFWALAELYVYLVLTLGGLFLPMYLVGRKYQ